MSMRSVVCQEAQLAVTELPDPSPGRGQVLLRVLRCGICGSDLHARRHCDELSTVMEESGYTGFMRSSDPVVFGHEFVGEIADRGPGGGRRLATGTRVVAIPLLRREGKVHPTGLSPQAPGAYSEYVLAEESLVTAVPNGLGTASAAVTEPMAVGLHAVRRSEISKATVAVVIGAGPIGLAVICALKARGVRTVVASDPSARRRELASACGADVVVDPGATSPYQAFHKRGTVRSVAEGGALLMSVMDNLARLPFDWRPVMRAGERLGLGPKGPVIFECVGVPGMIDEIIGSTPFFSRVVVVGVCMGADRIRPAMAINKEIDLRFVLGYTPLEFRDALHMLADGAVDPTPMLTGTVGLDGVDAAFSDLADADTHAKILIDPGLPRPAATAQDPSGVAPD
jgi:threonine dehydrogenase-like Zn-dependent dehydrogenase